MRFKSYLLFIFFFISLVGLRGQLKYYTEHYGIEDGLPQHTVMSILQDHKGFMWFATWNGICKFDGINFYSYRIQSNDSQHIRSNRIDFFIEDRFGYIWLLPYDREPCRFDPRTEKFVSLRDIGGWDDTSLLVNKIKPMKSGKVWLIKDDKGLICVQDSTFKLKNYNEEDVIYDVYEDNEYNSWILTANGLYVEESRDNSLDSYFVNRVNGNLSGFYSIMELDEEIWLGSHKGEIQIYNKTKKQFDLLKIKTQSNIKDIKKINDELILIVPESGGFFIYSKPNSEAEHYHKEKLAEMKNNSVKNCYIDRLGNMWFDLNCLGVAKFDVEDRTMKHFEIRNESKSASLTPPKFMVFEGVDDKVWVHPTGGGLSYYDPQKDILIPFSSEQNSSSWHFSNLLHTAFPDQQGNLWLSTRTHGLEKVVFPTHIFKSTIIEANTQLAENNDVRCVFEDNSHNLWVASKANKIFVYDQSGKQLGYLCENGTVAYGKAIDASAYSIMQDEDQNIWIGTKGRGLYKLTRESEGLRYKITNYVNSPNDIYSLSDNHVYSVFQDVKKQIWVGTFEGGLNLITKENNGKVRFINYKNDLSQYPIQTGVKIRVISADGFGNIYVGTTLGLIVFSSDFTDVKSIKFNSYLRKGNDSTSISANDIYDILTTAKGETFLATFGGGLNKVVGRNHAGMPISFHSYNTSNGLPSDVVMTLTEDIQDKLWVATEGNLSIFDPEKESFETFSDVNRLVRGIIFSEGARFSSKSGTIYIGHTKGFLSAKANKIIRNEFNPYVSFTNLLISNQVVPVESSSVLTNNIDDMTELRLNHKQNFFSIEFAALDYADPQSISYAYKLDNFDEDWITLPKRRVANYTNIEPGEYIFRVKSTNSDGIWMDNERTLLIVISPPFWKTTWAYILYFVLFIVLLYAVFRALFVYFRLKSKVDIEYEQTEMKTQFFMDVSHEIRTPLTMIIAPLENILDEDSVAGEVKSQIQLVLKNTHRMLRLVNQILDFRKIQKQKINLQEVSIARLISDVCKNFTETAELKNIQLKFVNNVGDSILWIDSDAIEKLMFNLLSNAFKHSPSDKTIEIVLSYTKKGISLSVMDQGMGMSKEILNKLFTRFSSFTLDKSNPSTGIGLSIVKEVAERHHAKIVVESEVSRGSCFTVYFQSGTEHFKDDDITFNYSSPHSVSSDVEEENEITISVDDNDTDAELMLEDHKTILIVEDDDDLRGFVRNVMSAHYTVIEASNGLDAYDIAITDQPDFIISDIMMDKLDGIGLLKKLKNNSETSHIPIILLTAKTNMETKLEGLEYGADDYITKPFSVKYLKAKIENIINRRKQLYESFTGKVSMLDNSEEEENLSYITNLDEEFILKMKKEIEQNIDNSEYVVNDLANAMAMSRTVFYKKVKSLTDLSPIEFIRDIKIKYAAQLLHNPEYSIKEVSYMVGISDTKYFTQCFKKQYGVTPSEYRTK